MTAASADPVPVFDQLNVKAMLPALVFAGALFVKLRAGAPSAEVHGDSKRLSRKRRTPLVIGLVEMGSLGAPPCE